jgi:hypothetical protein
VWTGCIWLRIGTSGGLLWTRWWAFGFHKMRIISWLAEWRIVLHRYTIFTSSFEDEMHTEAWRHYLRSFAMFYSHISGAAVCTGVTLQPVPWSNVSWLTYWRIFLSKFNLGLPFSCPLYHYPQYVSRRQFQWPCSLRRVWSWTTRKLGSWVRIPLNTRTYARVCLWYAVLCR